MNRTKIEWTDFTWNPVSGCWGPGGTAEKPNFCSYCYARRMAERFYPGLPGGKFTPHFFPLLLDEPAKRKKPAKIFVCSMGDLFGDWVSDVWICHILNQIVRPSCSQHIFQFLTKNPKRLKEFNPWPSNCWVGTTVTNQADADERLPWLEKVDAPVRFVSHEPLLGHIFLKPYLMFMDRRIDWAIIGAMTGPGAVKVDPAWVANLEAQYQAAGVPVFEKDSLQNLCGSDATLLRQWP